MFDQAAFGQLEDTDLMVKCARAMADEKDCERAQNDSQDDTEIGEQKGQAKKQNSNTCLEVIASDAFTGITVVAVFGHLLLLLVGAKIANAI